MTNSQRQPNVKASQGTHQSQQNGCFDAMPRHNCSRDWHWDWSQLKNDSLFTVLLTPDQSAYKSLSSEAEGGHTGSNGALLMRESEHNGRKWLPWIWGHQLQFQEIWWKPAFEGNLSQVEWWMHIINYSTCWAAIKFLHTMKCKLIAISLTARLW